MSSASDNRSRKSGGHRRQVLLLSGLVLGMFAFGFAMVPLYRLLCQVTGINSTTVTAGAKVPQGGRIDYTRQVTVEFDATVHDGLEWEFRPLKQRVKVHPGEPFEVSYLARNLTGRPVTAQAVPGITPWQATEFFNKVECFCFSRQTLEPDEEREMPVRFVVSPDLPDKYRTITLSYAFMEPAAERKRRVADTVHRSASETESQRLAASTGEHGR